MTIHLQPTPPDQLAAVTEVLIGWQDDAAPLQLHPGDLGWHHRAGRDASAAATLTWRRDQDVLAVALLDGPGVLRLTVAPHATHDERLTRQVVDDVTDPVSTLVPHGELSVEAPNGTLVQDLLGRAGWARGEGWTPLQHDLLTPLPASDLDVEVVAPAQPAQVELFAEVVRSAFGSTRFTAASWHAMATAPVYRHARSLLGRDRDGAAVAVATVWSAGLGRPGLLEPVGVHAEHRGRGHGTTICRAAVAHLQRMGASSAQVCTPTALTTAVATYTRAGFRRLPERYDRVRP